MKIRNKRISLTTLTLLLIISILTTALGVVLITKQLTMTASILSESDLEIKNTDTDLIISSYAWGEFGVLDSKEQNITIKNIGNRALNVSWICQTEGWIKTTYGYKTIEDRIEFYITDSLGFVECEVQYTLLSPKESMTWLMHCQSRPYAEYGDTFDFTIEILGNE